MSSQGGEAVGCGRDDPEAKGRNGLRKWSIGVLEIELSGVNICA